MGKRTDAPGTSYSIDVGDVLLEDPELRRLLEERARRIAALPPEERAKHDARQEAYRRFCEEDVRAYEEAEKEAERAVERERDQIKADRAAGLIGNLTEIGRPYGLSRVMVGRILDEHRLRERVDVYDHEDPHSVVFKRLEEEKRRRREELERAYPPERPRPPPAEVPRSPLHLMRGIVEGFAVQCFADGREFWIAAKVAPLLEAHAKRGK